MENYKCKICGLQFDKYQPFTVHCNRKHRILYKDLKQEYFPKLELPFKCKRCTESFNSYDGLRKHSARIHKINSHDFFVEYKLNGVCPTCKCGCGQRTKWSGKLHNFCEYVRGHQSRIKNNWGHNKVALQRSTETRKKQYASGERKVWNDGLTKETDMRVAKYSEMSKKENNPERCKKISQTQRQQFIDGIRNNVGINNPMYGKNHSPETVKKIFSYRKMNKLEKMVADELDKNNIQYYFQFFIIENGICKSYDFKIKNKPIIIELDGDYWHGGPGVKSYYKKVDEVKENDKIKNEIAQKNGYTLLRFWESDIKNNPAKVMKTLLNELPI